MESWRDVARANACHLCSHSRVSKKISRSDLRSTRGFVIVVASPWTRLAVQVRPRHAHSIQTAVHQRRAQRYRRRRRGLGR